MAAKLSIRWTIGNVSLYGFEALRLSIWGGWKVFGPEAVYTVCVNSVPLDEARRKTGAVPEEVCWQGVTQEEIFPPIKAHFDQRLADGVGWKFAPLQLYPDRHELALDNDCILWEMPDGIRKWIEDDQGTCLIAEDVRTCLGQFASFCGPEPRNSGIRGVPPGFDLEGAFQAILRAHPLPILNEQDEQGLQIAAISRHRDPFVVRVEEVTICSPFPHHQPFLGRCGAHFVSLNVKEIPWKWEGRPGSDHVRDHWRRYRDELYSQVGLAPPAEALYR